MAYINYENITAKTPWQNFVGDVPLHLDYFEGTMFAAVEELTVIVNSPSQVELFVA